MGLGHFLFSLWGLCGVLGASGFRICAFNLHGFGESKSNNEEVMKTIVKIIVRCDVCVLQEVRDSKHKALPKLLSQLNSYNRRYQFDHVASERLGRSPAYQEQYVFVYRTDSVSVTAQYQYPDLFPGSVDVFAREPFIVRFSAPRTAIKSFVLVPLHSSPTNATKEIDSLFDVFVAVKKKWKTEKILFLGDFNAGCSYLPIKYRKDVRLLTDRRFQWLIDHDVDTTVRESTDCAYDRIVVHADSMGYIVPRSAEPFLFPHEYHLTEEQALSVSDHYPVQVTLKSSSSSQAMKSMSGSTQNHVVFLSLILVLLVCWLNFSQSHI
ncbi:hypothetical protein NHX12_026489 [Muraenolepis orangiensis]|uniref:Deoxyribonuclease-1-like 1 n=1 Tax=Muraenolepis orangiensis TaxID=630683 RepID=A0A9Q0EHG6_9TELE|nr:hypothetical protein NHX12_026489 [Muraenolepis orangiensis]